MDLGITGKVALITVGSRGLGRQSALALASEGLKVAIGGRTNSFNTDGSRIEPSVCVNASGRRSQSIIVHKATSTLR